MTATIEDQDDDRPSGSTRCPATLRARSLSQSAAPPPGDVQHEQCATGPDEGHRQRHDDVRHPGHDDEAAVDRAEDDAQEDHAAPRPRWRTLRSGPSSARRRRRWSAPSSRRSTGRSRPRSRRWPGRRPPARAAGRRSRGPGCRSRHSVGWIAFVKARRMTRKTTSPRVHVFCRHQAASASTGPLRARTIGAVAALTGRRPIRWRAGLRHRPVGGASASRLALGGRLDRIGADGLSRDLLWHRRIRSEVVRGAQQRRLVRVGGGRSRRPPGRRR